MYAPIVCQCSYFILTRFLTSKSENHILLCEVPKKKLDNSLLQCNLYNNILDSKLRLDDT